jgi:(1->4)-alpha-D-glucan 1-alpha-D-glucosylmutase
MSVTTRIPTATYRLQLNRDFGFREAGRVIDYLAQLGISDVYASPILAARPGSTHGYDVTDPTRVNPDLGGGEGFEGLAARLRHAGLGLLLDIVPNHMAASPENPWWRDVLERGSGSPFARFFDTGWLDFGVPGARTAGHRRFFDLGQFVGVRVEEPDVFRETHALIFRFVDSGAITGLRVDHIDGLYDPLKYLRELQSRLGNGFYIVVEKILSGDETLPPGWPVSGTTGYDFAARLNELFVDGAGTGDLGRLYRNITGRRQDFREVVYRKKRQVIRELFARELKALGDHLAHLSAEVGADLPARDAARALAVVTACLPVYRTYVRSGRAARRDRRYLEKALGEAGRRRSVPAEALSFLRRVLLLDFPAGFNARQRGAWRPWVMRWQQLTGAVMAKGYEDTALYDYNRLVSLNDVGGDPSSRGLSLEAFHRWAAAWGKRWPYTLNATSTHDSKRSEDVRARISVLSEIPGEWADHLHFWMDRNRSKKIEVNGRMVPDTNTEYLLYQTLLGAWPLSNAEMPEFRERLKAYLVKAAREAKTHTSWLKVNEDYENALLRFIDAILEDGKDNRFLGDFLTFQSKIAFFGALNSLSQVLLKAALPGVPDFYQGNELWDFSLVDPDNRRPVDFMRREEMLDGLRREEADDSGRLLDGLRTGWRDGRIKLYVTYRALRARRETPGLFRGGDYRPFYAGGESRERVVAFLRRQGDSFALAAAPRFFTGLSAAGDWPVGEVWGDDRIILPRVAPVEWRDVFTGEEMKIAGSRCYLRELFGKLPVALLVSLLP